MNHFINIKSIHRINTHSLWVVVFPFTETAPSTIVNIHYYKGEAGMKMITTQTDTVAHTRLDSLCAVEQTFRIFIKDYWFCVA